MVEVNKQKTSKQKCTTKNKKFDGKLYLLLAIDLKIFMLMKLLGENSRIFGILFIVEIGNSIYYQTCLFELMKIEA